MISNPTLSGTTLGEARPHLHRVIVALGCVILLIAAVADGSELDKYSHYIVSDPGTGLPQPDQLRITYLGVNGYRFETADHVLLVDPYFSRVGFWRVTVNDPISPIRDRVDEGYTHITGPADAILVTHAHFDHLMDVPDLMRRTGAELLAGPSAVNLVRSFGTSADVCDIVRPGSVRHIGPWTIHVFAAFHDRLGSSIPYPGTVTTRTRPVRPSDWKVGEALAFIIEGAGKHVYIDSGGMPGHPPEIGNRKVDLAILGVALPDSRRRYAETVRRLQPRFILPSHQDDFFVPFDQGFKFGKLTSLPAILIEQRRQRLPGKVVLLDYFHPWTLR